MWDMNAYICIFRLIKSKWNILIVLIIIVSTRKYRIIVIVVVINFIRCLYTRCLFLIHTRTIYKRYPISTYCFSLKSEWKFSIIKIWRKFFSGRRSIIIFLYIREWNRTFYIRRPIYFKLLFNSLYIFIAIYKYCRYCVSLDIKSK